MADSVTPPPRFTIRRLEPDEEPRRQPPGGAAAGSSTPPAPPMMPEELETLELQDVPDTSPVAPSVGTAGMFRTASGVLGFLGAALGTELSEEAIVRRTPDGAWWGEVVARFEALAPLILAAGGRPYARSEGGWVALSGAGTVPDPDLRLADLNVDAWPILDLADLLAQTSLLAGRYLGAAVLDVVAPGSLGRWVLRRATALSLTVAMTPTIAGTLGRVADAPSGALVLRLRARQDRIIPAALVHSMINLPFVVVAEPVEASGRGILVDVRHRLPLAPHIILGMVPQGETWVLGPPDVGHRRLRRAGDSVDGSSLLQAPILPMAIPMELPAVAPLSPIPVSLVPRPGLRRRVDAVLLDEAELGWLRPFLMGRPIGEVGFLLPGPDRYLLTAPGGLPSTIPFGVPLTRVGPGGLYLELGTAFYPPLPDGACQTCFELDEQTAVAVVGEAAYRFDTAHMRPVWTLWVGDPPEVQTGISGRGAKILAGISAALRDAEAHEAPPDASSQGRAQVSRRDRVQLIEHAQRAELRGDLVAAAQMLEQAGLPGPAGRLYERAAGGGR